MSRLCGDAHFYGPGVCESVCLCVDWCWCSDDDVKWTVGILDDNDDNKYGHVRNGTCHWACPCKRESSVVPVFVTHLLLSLYHVKTVCGNQNQNQNQKGSSSSFC